MLFEAALQKRPSFSPLSRWESSLTVRLGSYFPIPFREAALCVGRLDSFANNDALCFTFHRGRVGLALLDQVTISLARLLRHVCLVLPLGSIASLGLLGGRSRLCSGLLEIRSIAAVGRLAPFATNLGHVLAVAAYGLSSLTTCGGGFLGIELVGRSLLMSYATSLAASLTCLLGRKLVSTPSLVGSSPPLSGNLTLLFLVHRGEAAFSLSHDDILPDLG